MGDSGQDVCIAAIGVYSIGLLASTALVILVPTKGLRTMILLRIIICFNFVLFLSVAGITILARVPASLEFCYFLQTLVRFCGYCKSFYTFAMGVELYMKLVKLQKVLQRKYLYYWLPLALAVVLAVILLSTGLGPHPTGVCAFSFYHAVFLFYIAITIPAVANVVIFVIVLRSAGNSHWNQKRKNKFWIWFTMAVSLGISNLPGQKASVMRMQQFFQHRLLSATSSPNSTITETSERPQSTPKESKETTSFSDEEKQTNQEPMKESESQANL